MTRYIARCKILQDEPINLLPMPISVPSYTKVDFQEDVEQKLFCSKHNLLPLGDSSFVLWSILIMHRDSFLSFKYFSLWPQKDIYLTESRLVILTNPFYDEGDYADASGEFRFGL